MAAIQAQSPFFQISSTTQSGALVVTTLTALLITLCAIISKLVLRGSYLDLRHYDLVLLCGVVLLFAQTGLMVCCAQLGVGNHRDTISTQHLDDIRKIIYTTNLLGIGITFCSKISMCLFIRTINSFSFIRTANIALMGAILTTFISSLAATAFPCQLPPWLIETEEACPAAAPIYRYTIISGAITDVFITVIPMIMIARVLTGLRAKFTVVALFSLRLSCPLTSIPAILDTTHLYNGEGTDFTWQALFPTVWLTLSWNLSVITACIPSLKGLFDGFLGNTSGAAVEIHGITTTNGRTKDYVSIDSSKFSKKLSSFRSRESTAACDSHGIQMERLDSAVKNQPLRGGGHGLERDAPDSFGSHDGDSVRALADGAAPHCGNSDASWRQRDDASFASRD